MCERSLKLGTDLQFACCVVGWPGAVNPFRHVMPFLRSLVCHPMAADVAASCRNTFLPMHSAITYTLKHLCARVCAKRQSSGPPIPAPRKPGLPAFSPSRVLGTPVGITLAAVTLSCCFVTGVPAAVAVLCFRILHFGMYLGLVRSVACF